MNFAKLKARHVERFQRCYTGEEEVSLPLLKVISMDPWKLVMLQARAGDLLAANVDRHNLPLGELENVTPGGRVMEYGKAFAERRALDAEVYSALRGIKVSHWASTPILRVVDGVAKPERAARAYSTDKLHTDVWAGEPRYSVNLIIPLLGAGVDCEFVEPEFIDRFEPVADYIEGGAVPGKRYEVTLRCGNIYLFDCMCLHRTVRTGTGLRVSVDLRGLYEDRIEGDESPWKFGSEFTERATASER